MHLACMLMLSKRSNMQHKLQQPTHNSAADVATRARCNVTCYVLTDLYCKRDAGQPAATAHVFTLVCCRLLCHDSGFA